MADLPKPSDLLKKVLPNPQDLLEKKNPIQKGQEIGSEPLNLGLDRFQTQVPTEAPSVLTPKGQVDYQEQVKDFKPAIQKPISKPKTLSEAVSNDDSYIGAIWNQIPNSVSDFVGGLSKLVGKGAAQMYGKPVELLFDVVNKTGGKNIVNPIKELATYENIESVAKLGEKAVKKLRTSASSEEYERSIQEGFNVTDGVGFQDVKAIPVMLARLVADAGLSIPTAGLSFVAQGYNQGLNEYDEAVKDMPKDLRSDNAREGFGVMYGTINGLADKLGLDFITKSKPVSETVKKYILKEAVKELAKKEAKNITSNVIESTIANIAKSTFNKVKAVGVKTAIGATGEGVTEPIQGGLSDGLKILTNKLSGSDVFDVNEIKENFWKSRINDAAGGFVLGGALGGAINSLKSTDSYIAERVAESTTPEQIQLLKEELVNSVDDNGNPLLDEEKINILNSAIDKYSEANQKLPAGLSTEKRAKALQLISERDEIKASRDAAIQNIDNVDEAIKPEMEGDMVIFENKEQQKNDEIREAVTGSKYKYFQDEDGKFYKKLGDGKAEEISQEYFNLQNQDTEIGDQLTKKETDAVQVETTGQVPVQPEAPVSEEVEQGKPQPEAKVAPEESAKAEEVSGGVIEEDARMAMYKEMDSQRSAKENELIEKQKQDIKKAKNDLGAINNGDKNVIDEYVKKSGYKLVTKEVIAKNPKSELLKKSEGKYYNSTGASIQVKTAKQIAIDGASKKANSKTTGSKTGTNQYVDAYNAITKFSEGKITAEEAKTIIEKSGLKIPKAVEQSLLSKEQTPPQEVEQLRAEEQAELKAAIPNADQYLTDGKVDRTKITDAKELKKFDKIYDKYDKLITPLLPKKEVVKAEEVAPVKPIADLKQDVKKAKGKEAKSAALQTLKENSSPEDFKAFMDENPVYKKYEVKAEPIVEQEISDDTEIELPTDKKDVSKDRLAELEKQKKELFAKIRKAGSNLNTGFSPEVISDLVKLGAVYIEEAIIKLKNINFAEFSAKLKNDYGRDIPEDIIRDIFRKSAEANGVGVRRTPERIGTGEAVSDSLKEVANETDALYQTQNYKEIQDRLDNMSEADKNTLVGTLANVTGQLNAEGNVGVLAAIDLINMYEANGDKAGAKRVFDTISKSATAFAQLLRQYGQLKSSTPQGYVSIVEKYMLDKYGVKLTDAQKQAIEKLYNDSKKAIDIEADALNNLVDDLTDANYKFWGETTVLLEDANRKLADYIDSLKPATAQSLFQKLTSIVQGNLLSLKSLLVNPVANAAQAGIRLSGNEVANLLDFVLNVVLKTGRTKISGFDPQAIRLGGKAFIRGLSKANRMLIKGSTATDLAKIDVTGRLKPVEAWKSLYKTLRGKQAFEFVKTIEDLAEGTIGFPANLALRLLPYGDLPRNEQVKLAKLIEIGRNKFGLKGKELEAFTLKPDPESLSEAELEGDKSTLQEPNKAYTFLNNIINSIDSKADDKFVKGILSGIKFVVRGTIVPFLKTPINYAAKAIRFTNPIIPYSQAVYNMVKAIQAAKNIKNPLLRESAIRKHQSKLTEYLGEAIIAQSIMSAALILIGNGLVTGDVPDDDKKEKDLMYQSLGPNMINISGLKRLLTGGDPTYKQGDTAIAYNALGILGAQLGISSNTLTTKEKENIREQKFVTTEGKPFYKEDKGFYLSSIAAMSSNLPASLNFTLNQGFAQGTGTLLASIQDNKYSEWSNQMVKTLVTGLNVPNTVYQSFKAGNDYYRNVYTEDQVKTWANIVQERYGNLEGLPINHDMWGKPIKLTPKGSNPYVYHLIDIFRTQKILQDKNTYYVFDLYKKTGDKSVIPSSVKDIIDEEGGVYTKLKAEQKSELQRIVGEERAKYVNGVRGGSFSLKNYDPTNDNEKYLEKQVNKLKLANELGLDNGKRRFEKEILSKTKK